MKTLYLVLKYVGIAIACYISVLYEIGLWYGVGIPHVFPRDALNGKWLFNMENPSLADTARRFAIIVALLPLGWLNVFVTYKLFRQLPKAIWLMVLITTYGLFLVAWALAIKVIPGYFTKYRRSNRLQYDWRLDFRILLSNANMEKQYLS